MLNELLETNRVFERFTYFSSFYVYKFVVHPVPCKRLAGSTLTLCNLIVVVRAYEVYTTCVYIYFFSQVFKCHSRALKVPAREASSPWAFPTKILISFPKRKINRV